MQAELKQPLNLDLKDIEKSLNAYETQERKRLGLTHNTSQWHDPNPQHFQKNQRKDTTILFGGLTIMQDRLIEAGLSSLGYRITALDCPDNDALQIGKEFGNRGQCNPTYFTVGNLVKYLINLRDNQGIETSQIIKQHVFVTAGACGPCRFGTYVTEYRKALRDAGFEGFRVFLFKTGGGLQQGDADHGLGLTPKFFLKMFKCIMLGDILNLIGYRLRPYEKQRGATDKALSKCKDILSIALRNNKQILPALWRCRKVLSKLDIDRTQVKPKASIIGEFWAMTTEGDGNYRLQRFLEDEGAECEIQPVTNWILYIIWGTKYDARMQLNLRRSNADITTNKEKSNPVKTLILTRVAMVVVRNIFTLYARTIGLSHYHLTDMDEIADLSHEYYKNELRGGEGHMEVGKLILNVKKNKSHLVISVKPFGCMPSSGVSDGVQSLITSKYPNSNYLPIETTGDGAVNAYSRIQMALFKARKKAQAEYESTCEKFGGPSKIEQRFHKKQTKALRFPQHTVAGTAANVIYDTFSNKMTRRLRRVFP